MWVLKIMSDLYLPVFFINEKKITPLIYCSDHKDQCDVKKKSKCELNFYFKDPYNISSWKNKDIKVIIIMSYR